MSLRCTPDEASVRVDRKVDGGCAVKKVDWRAFSAADVGYVSSSLTRRRAGTFATPGSMRIVGGSINCREISAMSS